GMLLCGSGDEHLDTAEVALVPVRGLPESSFGLVWPRGARNPGVPALASAFFETLVRPVGDKSEARRHPVHRCDVRHHKVPPWVFCASTCSFACFWVFWRLSRHWL